MNTNTKKNTVEHNLEYDLFEELIEIDILKDSMCFAKDDAQKEND